MINQEYHEIINEIERQFQAGEITENERDDKIYELDQEYDESAFLSDLTARFLDGDY